MSYVDRGIFVTQKPYKDSSQPIGDNVKILAPHVASLVSFFKSGYRSLWHIVEVKQLTKGLIHDLKCFIPDCLTPQRIKACAGVVSHAIIGVWAEILA
ncbi:unnamed protein product [Trichobilharzia regenti]|uniref:Transferred entry: 3.1.21.10 n=1 Tax=Trichobilharzia regenti TaxID=157069 RepID=A0A183VIL6_TRIRE|nr:unnamed protein product [Trichobilharzia regenti]CAH8862762.1 unnamed protein product [Trichobilharzia regenti]VDP97092.1 unnamed protein product [Trichobilharzia regenti]